MTDATPPSTPPSTPPGDADTAGGKRRFPSMKASELLRRLTREPLCYEIVRQRGSHRILRASDRPQILFSYHDGATVPPGLVRKILMNDVGLTDAEVWDVLR